MGAGSGKGIEWMIDLDARTQGATDVIAALGKTRSAAEVACAAIDRALRSMDKLPKSMGDAGWSKGLDNLKTLSKGAHLTDQEFALVKSRTAQVTAELERLGPVAEKSGGSMFREFFKAELLMEGLKLGAELAVEAVKKVGEVAWDALKIAGGSERTSKVFANLLGPEEGKKTLEYMERFSKLSEFTGGQVKSLGAELVSAGLKNADFRNALGAAADVAALSTRNKTTAFGEAIGSLANIARTGRVSHRTLGGLELNPHDVEKQLSKDLGLAPAVVKKKLLEGTLQGVEAIGSIFTVLEQKTGKQLGQAGEEMSTGLLARLDKLKEVPEEIFKGLKNTEGFQEISDTIERITEMLSPESDMGKRVLGALGRAIDVVGEKIENVNWEGVAESFIKIVDKTTEWIDPLIKVAKIIGDIVGYGSTAVGWLAKIALMPVAAPVLAAGWLHGKATESKDREALIASMGDANEAAWQKYGEAQGRAAGKGVIAGGKDALESHSPSRVWMRLGEDSAEGFALGMESGSARVRGATATAAAPAVGDLGGAVGTSSTFNAGGFTVAPTIIVQGSSASAQEIQAAAEQGTYAALLSALEQFNVAAGLA